MAPRGRPRIRAATPEPAAATDPTLAGLIGAVGQVTNLLAQTIAANNQQHERANQAREQAEQARGQQHPRGNKSVMDDFRRENPPVFYGSTEVEEVISWKSVMAKKFDLLKCTDEERLRFSIYKLEGDAEQWWKTTEAALQGEQPVTWADFQREFDKKYYTDQMRDKKEAEFYRLVQGGMSVANYEAKFTSLSKFAEIPDEGRKARKFVRGLNESIRSLMRLERYESYSKAVTHAMNVEATEGKRSQEQNQNFKRAQPYQGGSSGNNQQGNFDAQKRQRWNNNGPQQGQAANQNRGPPQG